MRLHYPELFEAHRLRSEECLTYIAGLMGLTLEQANERNWQMSDIDDNVAPPGSETPAPAAPKRRGRPPGGGKATPSPTTAKSANSQADSLLKALAFVAPAESDVRDFGEYVRLSNNLAVCFNGQLAAGHPIVEALTLSPHLDKLTAALKRCGKSLVLTENQSNQLTVKGDKLKVVVPCYAQALPPAEPDAPNLTGDFDVLKLAFEACGLLANEKAERVLEASLLLDPNVCTGTNSFTMLQYWHGIANLPAGTVIPKTFAVAVARQDRKITGIGGTFNVELGHLTTLTIWFDGGAWLKTQCYNDRWPAIDHILNFQSNPVAVPNGFFDALEAVIPFCDSELKKSCFMFDKAISSHFDRNTGATYEVKELPDITSVYDGSLLLKVKKHITTIDLTSNPRQAAFFGQSVRGVIASMAMPGTEA